MRYSKHIGKFAVTFIFILCFMYSCKKDDFSINMSNALRDGNPWASTASAFTNLRTGEVALRIFSPEDEYSNSLQISIMELPQQAFRYDFTASDDGINFDPVLHASVGSDAGCARYFLDREVSTNFFEVSYFSMEDCIIRGSYDLTFRLDEQRGNSCSNPTYGPVIRFTEGSFESRIEGCE